MPTKSQAPLCSSDGVGGVRSALTSAVGFLVSGFCLLVSDVGFLNSSLEVRVSVFWFRVSRFGFRFSGFESRSLGLEFLGQWTVLAWICGSLASRPALAPPSEEGTTLKV